MSFAYGEDIQMWIPTGLVNIGMEILVLVCHGLGMAFPNLVLPLKPSKPCAY